MTRILRGLVAWACLAVCAGMSAFAETDENGLTPKHWYKFDGNLNSSGETALTVGGENGASYVDSGKGGQAYQFKSGYHPYGSNIKRGSGDFTVVTVAKTADLDHGMIWTQGTKGSGRGFGLVAVGADKVAVRVFGSNWSSSGSDIIMATVSDATESYHVYTLIYKNSGYTFSLYVDDETEPAGTGSVADSATESSFPNNNFQWGSLHTGVNYSMTQGYGVCLDDFRLYQTALTTEQIKNIVATFRSTSIKWGTAGKSGEGVATSNDGAFGLASWTFNFSKDDHIVHDTIDTTKKVVFKKIRLMQRKTKANKPTAATLTQGTVSAVATSVTSVDDESGMTLYGSDGTAVQSWAYHEIVFDGETEFDPTENITLSFGATVGCWVMKPANSVMVQQGWSPVIEMTAAYPSDVADYVATIDGDTAFSGITTWVPARPAAGFESTDVLEIDNTAPAKLTMDESFTVKKLKIVNAADNALTLDVQTTPNVTTWDFAKAAGGVVFDASGLNGTELAKNAVAGAPYSHWLLKGSIRGSENVTVTLPTMPSGYDVEKVIDSYGLRIVVTAPKTALFGSVDINFMGNQSQKTTDANSMVSGLTTDVGAHPVVGTSWTDLESKNYSATVEKYVNSEGTLVTGASIPVTISQCANSYGSGAANNTIFHGYIDDSQHPIVQISNIPFAKYRVILYRATDTANMTFSAAQIGTTADDAKIYYGPVKSKTDSGYTLSGSSEVDWGYSDQRANPVESVNYIVSDVLEGTAGSATAYVYSHKHAGRATVAAIQIVEVGKIVEGYKEYKATISSAGTHDLSSLTWTPSPFAPTSSDFVKVTIDPSVTEEVTINLDKNDMQLNQFLLVSKGDATIKLTGNNPAAISAWDFSGVEKRVAFGFETDFAKVTLGTYPLIGIAYSYTGTIQSGFEYLGTGNTLTLTTISSGTVIIGGSGTLHGDLNVMGLATVKVGGKYTSPDKDVELSSSNGLLEILEGADISVTSICCYRDRAWGGVPGNYTINGTLRVTSECGSDVASQTVNHKGIIFKRDNSSTGMNITIGAKGALLAESTWILLNRDPQGTCTVVINGGVVRARGINVGSYTLVYAPNPTITVSNGGTLQLAEGLVNQNNGRFTINASTLSAYPYNGSTGYNWTPNTTTVSGDVTLDLNGLNINVPNTLSGAGAKVVVESETVGGTLTLAGSNTFEKGMSILSGATVKPGGISAFGTGAITVSSGATLDCNGVGIANSITVSGSGVNGVGALVNMGASVQFVANVSLADDVTIGGASGIAFLTGSALDLGGHSLTVSGDGFALKLEGLTVANGSTVAVAQGTLAVSGATSLGDATLTIAKTGILDLSASGSISCRDFVCRGSVAGNRAELIVNGTLDATAAVTIPRLQLADGVTLKGTGLTVTGKITMGNRLFVVLAASELQPTFRLAVVPEDTVDISKNVTVNGTKDYVMLHLGDKLLLTKEDVVLADVSLDDIVGWTNFEELRVDGRIRDFSGTATSGGKTNINIVIASQGGSVTTQRFEFVDSAEHTFSYVLDGVTPGQTYEVTVFVTITDTYVYNNEITKDAVASRPVDGWIYEDAETFTGVKDGTGIWYGTNGVARASGGVIGLYAEDWSRAAEFQPTNMTLEIDYSSVKDLHFLAEFDCPGFYTYESYPVVQDGVSAAFTLVADADDNCCFAVVSGGQWVVVPRTVFAPAFETQYDVLVRLDGENRCITYSVVSGGNVVRLATCPVVDSKDVSLDLAGSGSVKLIEGIGQDSNLARVGDEEFKNYDDAIAAAGGTNSIAPLWWSRYAVKDDSGKFRIVDPNGWLELIWQKWHHWGIEDGFYRYVSGNNWIEYADASGVVEGNDGGWLVTNEVGLAWIAEQSTNRWFCGTVSVGTNLDLSSKNWTPIAQFSGAFDGQGYSIAGLNNTNVIIDPLLGEAGYYFGGPSNDWGYTAYGLFASATNASFANVAFEDVAISNVADSTASLLGVYAGGDLSVSNVTVSSGRVEGEGRAVAGILTVGGTANGDITVMCNTNRAVIAGTVANDADGGNVAQVLAGTSWGTVFEGEVVATNNVGEGAFDVRVADDGYSTDWYDSRFNWFDLPVCNFAAAVIRFTEEDGFRRFVEANDPDSVPIDPVYRTARMLADRFANGAGNIAGTWMDRITAMPQGGNLLITSKMLTNDTWQTVSVDRSVSFDLHGNTIYTVKDTNTFCVTRDSQLSVSNGTIVVPEGVAAFRCVGASSVISNDTNIVSVPGDFYDRTVWVDGGFAFMDEFLSVMGSLPSGTTVDLKDVSGVSIDTAANVLMLNGQRLARFSEYRSLVPTAGMSSYVVALNDNAVPEFDLDMSSAASADGTVSISLAGTRAGLYYAVQRKASLVEKDWSNASEWVYVETDGTPVSFKLPAEDASGFFRVEVTDVDPAAD